MSFALDITEGQPIGHSVRSRLIGMRVAEVAGVPDDERSALFYAPAQGRRLLVELGAHLLPVRRRSGQAT